MKFFYLVSLLIVAVATVVVRRFSERNGVVVDIDECLLNLRRSLDNTKQNVDYEDNRNIARILQGYIGLSTKIDFDFERFMRQFIGGMGYELTRAYSAPLTWAIGNETLELQTFWSTSNLSVTRKNQFDFIFESVKVLVEGEIEEISRKIRNSSLKSNCSGIENVFCEKLVEIAKETDEIFRVDARDSKKNFNDVGRAIEEFASVIEGNYGHKCVNEEGRDPMKQCVWESMVAQRTLLKMEFMKNRHIIRKTFDDKFYEVKENVQKFLKSSFESIRNDFKSLEKLCYVELQ